MSISCFVFALQNKHCIKKRAVVTVGYGCQEDEAQVETLNLFHLSGGS